MAWRKIEAGAPAGLAPRCRRVLHVVGRMNPGGVETWLVHVLRRMDAAKVRQDFLVLGEAGAYAGEVRRAGGRLLRAADPARQPLAFLRDFSRVLRDEGPYDAVHCHVHHFGGVALWAARLAGVPTRISHSHLDTESVDAEASPLRRAYYALSRVWIRQHATHLLAVGHGAARALFGPGFAGDPRYRLFACGVDFSRFAAPVDRPALRRALGLPVDAKVIGNVGRLEAQKNHELLLEVLAHAPELHAVIVGDGALRASLRSMARRLGVEPRVVWAGARTDVEKILPALDAFVFPSRFEGLGLAALEAQACGLPCIVSEAVPAEVAIVPELVRHLPVEAGAAFWAEEILRTLDAPRPVGAAEALRALRQSRHDVDVSAHALELLYLAG